MSPQKITTYDFDGTLTMLNNGQHTADPNWSLIRDMFYRVGLGETVFIVTGRRENCDSDMPVPVPTFVKQYQLPVSGIIYASHQIEKGPSLKALGSQRHYDDNPDAIASAKECGILMTLLVTGDQFRAV